MGFERANHVGNSSSLADVVLPWVPHLEHLKFFHVNQVCASSILKHCRQLKSLVQTKDHFTIFAKLGQNAGHQFEAFARFMRDGATLRVLSGPVQLVDSDEIVQNPWSCDQLEVLHCQIGYVERLLPEEEGILDELSTREDGTELLVEEQDVVQKYARSFHQYRYVYLRLASL